MTVTDAIIITLDTYIYFDPLESCFVFIPEENRYNIVSFITSGDLQSEEIEYIWITAVQESEI